MPDRDAVPIRACTLICHSHVALACRCLGTWRKRYADPLTFQLHDDGSLTDADVDVLTAALGDVRLVLRREADQRMAEMLASRPAARRFRGESCMGLKLLDAVLLSEGEPYVYVDTDVMLLRPARALFDVGAGRPFRYMHDAFGDVHSLRSWQLLSSRGVRLPSRFNAGLLCLRRAAYDLDYVEWFLADPWHRGNEFNGMPEQSTWASMAMRQGCEKWEPAQVSTVDERTDFANLVVGHFVAVGRHRLDECERIADALPADVKPVRPSVRAAGRCTSFGLFCKEARVVGERAARRILGATR